MMTVNDLRLGNLVSLKEVEYTVFAIDGHGGVRLMNKAKTGTTPYYDEDISPVVLTEDILPKLGINKDVSGRYFGDEVELYFIDKTPIGNEFAIFINLQYPFVIKKIKTVHELQNIWFDLNDIELTINL